MATNEHFLLAILLKVGNTNDKMVHTIDEAIKNVKRERSLAKLTSGTRTEPLVRKALRKLDQNALIEFADVDGQPGFRVTARGIHEFKRAVLEYPARTRRAARSPCSLRAREVFRLGSFLKKRLIRDTDDLFEEMRDGYRATRDLETTCDVDGRGEGMDINEMNMGIPDIQVHDHDEETSGLIPAVPMNPSSPHMITICTQKPTPRLLPAPRYVRPSTHFMPNPSFREVVSESDSNLGPISESETEFDPGSHSNSEHESRSSYSSTLYRTPSPEAQSEASAWGSVSGSGSQTWQGTYRRGRKRKGNESTLIEFEYREDSPTFDGSDRNRKLASSIGNGCDVQSTPAVTKRRARVREVQVAGPPVHTTGPNLDLISSRTPLAPIGRQRGKQMDASAFGGAERTRPVSGLLYGVRHPYKKPVIDSPRNARQARTRARVLVSRGVGTTTA